MDPYYAKRYSDGMNYSGRLLFMGRMILAGGGNAEQSKLVDEFFVALLPRKKFLFIPHAIAPKQWSFEKAREWIHKGRSFQSIKIVMWETIKHKSLDDLMEFDAIYLMGGNTFELLFQLRTSGFLDLMQQYLASGKTIYGISAGAYVPGKDIQDRIPPDREDKNAIGLKDLDALNLLEGYSVHCHYLAKHDKALFTFNKKVRNPLIAIPEDAGVYAKDKEYLALGNSSVYLFKNDGTKTEIRPGQQFNLL